MTATHSIPLFLFACTDYSLKKETPEPLPPSLVVSHAQLELGVSCPDTETNVMIHNGGDAPLSISSASISGEGWVLLGSYGGLSLQADESVPIHLKTDGGLAELLIESTDEENPVVSIPLISQLNQPPSFELNAMPEVVALTPVDMSATVQDDGDSPEHLLVQWRSDVDGVFGVESPNTEGYLATQWRPYHSPGLHQIQLMVTDSCMSSTSQLHTLCQQGGFTSSMLSGNDVKLTESASCDADWNCILGVGVDSAGSVFFEDQSYQSDRLSIAFQAELANTYGFALSLRPTSENRRLAESGPCLGIGSDDTCTGAENAISGLAIVFQTQAGFASVSQVSLVEDGDVFNPLVVAQTPDFQGVHYYEIELDDNSLSVYMDGALILNDNSLNLAGYPSFLGFTASGFSDDSRLTIGELSVLERICGN